MLDSSIERSCLQKRRFEAEADARRVGRIRVQEIGFPLFVYRCAVCGGYHLTKRTLSEYWSVNYDLSVLDEYDQPIADPLFWDRLVDMEMHEAEYHLRRLQDYTKTHLDLQDENVIRFRRRAKIELVWLTQQTDGKHVRKAIKQLFGDDGYDKVIALLQQSRVDDGMEWR